MQLTYCDLYADFFHYFSVELATSPEQHRLAAQLRHRVFSDECGFEPPSAEGIERDAYDAHSVQCLIRHRRSGIAASGIRLILAGKGRPLALEELCPDHIHIQFRRTIAQRRDGVCEASRFVVHPLFRRGALGGHGSVSDPMIGDVCATERRCYGQLHTVALLAALAMATLYGRDWMFCLLEPPTSRLVRRTAGVELSRAGKSLEYRGLRAPFCVTATAAMSQLRSELAPASRAVFVKVAQDLARSVTIRSAVNAA